MAKLNIKERSKMTFEEKMKKLDEIVKTMSENKLPLEDTIKIFEEGQKLIKELKEQLKIAEEKVVKEIN
jgi:exodeoxyribonuclease VII small subunit